MKTTKRETRQDASARHERGARDREILPSSSRAAPRSCLAVPVNLLTSQFANDNEDKFYLNISRSKCPTAWPLEK